MRVSGSSNCAARTLLRLYAFRRDQVQPQRWVQPFAGSLPYDRLSRPVNVESCPM